jgi:CRP/FNR family transcriptional regulator, cyclic AMP receptor protein
MQSIEALKQVPLFSLMDDEELAGVHALMESITFAPGQVIMRESEGGDLFYVITQGKAQVLVMDASGHELMLEEIGPGGFFGELAMLTGEPRLARVRAIDTVTTMALDQGEFFGFLAQHPPAAIDVLKTLGTRLHRSENLLRQSVSRNVNQLADERLTISQRIADTIAEFSGTVTFLAFNVIWFGAWLLWNQPWFPGYDYDPYPFGLLTMIVSLEAIFLSIFVLISQNRQSLKDRLAAEIDHKVNAKAEIEIGLVLRRLDDLERSLHYNHDEQHAILRQLSANGTPLPPTTVSGGTHSASPSIVSTYSERSPQ